MGEIGITYLLLPNCSS